MGNGLQLMRVVADLQVSRNREIMHSIEYASVIQQSTLRSSLDALARACPEAHLVWEPRDVVGGDFYQFSTAPDGWFATVADCTGHGVPGAFMTLIASTSLNQAIEQHGARDPAKLLGNVNRSIKQMLGQIGEHDGTPGSDDGMDAACFWFEARAGPGWCLPARGCRCSCCAPAPMRWNSSKGSARAWATWTASGTSSGATRR